MRCSLLLVLIICSCSSTKNLNQELNRSQLVSIRESPFKTANGIKEELSIQKTVRNEYIKEINDLLINNPQDTVILKEIYDYICIGCPANYVMIFFKNRLIVLEKTYNKQVYERTEKILAENLKDPKGYFHTV